MEIYLEEKLIGVLNENILIHYMGNDKTIEREVVNLPLNIYSAICTHCGRIYDIRKAEITNQYNNITEFITPCCHMRCDDRPFKKDFVFLKNL